MQRYQKTPYSRPTPTHAQNLGTQHAMAKGNTTRAAEINDPFQTTALPYSSYASSTSQTQQLSSPQPYSTVQPLQRVATATYSVQAMKTFAPQYHFPIVTPQAAMVPIQSLQPEKSFVRVSGRTVRAPDIRMFPNRWDSTKKTWLMSFTIKDEFDTIDVKFWHKTQEHLSHYAHITLNQVIHIWTDEVKLNSQSFSSSQSSYIPTTSSPYFLSLSEGRVGHKIEVGSEQEMETLYRVALGANLGGVVPSVLIKHAFNALGTTGNQRFNIILCIKKRISSGVISSKNGPLIKTCYTVFDTQGQEASMTMWGEILAEFSKQWIPHATTLIITGGQMSMYANKPQITIGYHSHIQVDPTCKNVEWLKHFASQNAQKQGINNDFDDVRIDFIQTKYHIGDIPKLIDSMEPIDINYGFVYCLLCELDIDNTASDILTAKCPICGATISSYRVELCSNCHVTPNGENVWQYSIAKYISFMDDTAELRHPSISSAVAESFLGFKPDLFSTLTLMERAQLKRRFFLEHFKVHFKISWSENKKQHIVQIISMARALASEINQENNQS